MATVTDTTGLALGNIPLSTVMVDKDATVTLISGASDTILENVSGLISSAISTVWKAGGSKAATDLTSALLVAANEGYVYNLTTDATTTSDWVEGADKTILAGTDVAVINTAASGQTAVYKFNALAPRDASVVKSIALVSTGGTVLYPTSGEIELPAASSSTCGLMTIEGYKKLSGIASGAEVNQNAFAKVAVSGQSTVEADAKSDTLTLVAGDNVTITTNASSDSVTINASVPAGIVYQVGGVSPTCGNVYVSGVSGISVYSSGDHLIVNGGTLEEGLSGLNSLASGMWDQLYDDGQSRMDRAESGIGSLSGMYDLLSGDISGIKNFSKVTVVDSTGTTVTNGALTPGSNADDTLKLKAGDNVTLSVAANTKTVTIAATGSVTGAKISGASSLASGNSFAMSGKTIIVPTAATGGFGVTKLTNTIDSSSGLSVTPYAVSGAISGVNSGLATKVGGSNLHSGLVAESLPNPGAHSGNTIYALLAALHSVDGQSES